jgi:hypothetical protein
MKLTTKLLFLLIVAGNVGCGKEQQQAVAKAPAEAINKAKQVEQVLQEAADKQQESIKKQTE